MKKTYDVRAIMARAWDIRKTAAAEIGCKVGEVVMGECLRLAWAEAEGVNAEDNALEIVKEWADMADADKVRMMAACVRKAAKNEIGYSTEDHYLQFSEVPAFGCYRPHDFDEFVNETCIRVLSRLADVDKLTATNERRAAQGKRPLRLVSVVYNAARASIAAVYYADSKHGAAANPPSVLHQFLMRHRTSEHIQILHFFSRKRLSIPNNTPLPSTNS